MNESRKQLIERLAIAAHRAAETHRAYAMLNVATDPEERERQSVAYAFATAEMFETRKALDNELSQPPPPPFSL